MAPQKQPERLKHVAAKANSSNPSQLGDPVSLKAEVSKLSPTEEDLGAAADSKTPPSSSSKQQSGGAAGGAKNSDGSPVQDYDKRRLKDVAKENLESGNPSQLGDPVSLKAEVTEKDPAPGRADGQRVEKSKL
ncbi:hypothetical protein BDP55DRAFT_734093 [Colletotrichum godetiae]|uniref:Uncharacterized protein n=1 Tax=Colletotrichum godetiae TaxID=1209918 RepID=A0AAJ0ERE6_9PEZI|nr:uncharacterized protein BDP55DRAFT_734093 [Colletotrichum godetiae]KAK1658474.1 hypothetical protein BDP55DRAFT_734093 [Colletotrichum godetiae]